MLGENPGNIEPCGDRSLPEPRIFVGPKCSLNRVVISERENNTIYILTFLNSR